MSQILCVEIEMPGGGTTYLATRPYASRPSDTPANVFMDGRLLDVVYERALSHPAWSRAGGGVAVSGIEIVNIDREFDSWIGLNWKGKRATLKSVAPRAAYSTATAVGSMVIQGVEVPAGNRIRLTCGSTLELLAKPVTRVYSQSISNTQLRGQARPLVLGRVRWADPRPQRLNSGSTRGLYDVTDDVFESIVEVRRRGLLQTEQPAPQLATGGFFVDVDECQGFRFGEQLHRLAAEVRGNVRRGDQMLAYSTFSDDDGGGYPLGWDVVEGGSGYVQWNSAGSVTIVGDGTAATHIAQDLTLVNGQLYQLEVDVFNQTGTATLLYGSTVVRSFETVAPLTLTAVFTATTGTDDVRLGMPTGTSGSLDVSAFRCFPVFRIDTLAEVMRFAAGRASVAESELDLSGAAAIQSASDYQLALASTTELTGDALVRNAALSYGCGLFQSRNGTLKPARLAAPAASADFTLQQWQILGDIAFEADRAPGLSTRMHFGRNYVQHSDDDMSGITDPSLRAELSREVGTVTTTASLHAMYATDAGGRDPIESMLAESADAQAEIDRLCGLYTVPRGFYTLRARVDDSVTAYTIEPGQTVELFHRQYGMSAGRKLLVVMARSNFTSSAVDLVLWGAST